MVKTMKYMATYDNTLLSRSDINCFNISVGRFRLKELNGSAIPIYKKGSFIFPF